MTSEVAVRSTARLILRPPNEEDLAFLVDLYSRSELVAHQPDPKPDDENASAARLAGYIAHWQQHGFGRWAVQRDGVPIGFGGLTRKAGFTGLNLSYHLHPDVWGQGYASEIVSEALRVAFDDLSALRVIGLVRPANRASRRVLERVGFTQESVVTLGGAPSDLLVRYADERYEDASRYILRSITS